MIVPVLTPGAHPDPALFINTPCSLYVFHIRRDHPYILVLILAAIIARAGQGSVTASRAITWQNSFHTCIIA